MVEYVNECLGCATESYPCLGSVCPNRQVARFYCDECGEETTLYRFNGRDLCIDCVKNRLEVVKGSEELDEFI